MRTTITNILKPFVVIAAVIATLAVVILISSPSQAATVRIADEPATNAYSASATVLIRDNSLFWNLKVIYLVGSGAGSATNLSIVGGNSTALTNKDATASTVAVYDGNKILTNSPITTALLANLSGLTGNIQAQINNQVTNTGGGVTNVFVNGFTFTLGTNNDATASTAAIYDANKKLVSSIVTTTELSNLHNVGKALTNGLDTAELTGTNTVTGGVITATTNVTAAVSMSSAAVTGTNSVSGGNITSLTNIYANVLYLTNIIHRTSETLAYTSATNLTPSSTVSRHLVTMTNTTFFAAPSGMVAGDEHYFFLTMDGTGGYAVTFQTNAYRFAGGTVPTITSTAGAICKIHALALNTSNFLCDVTLNYK